jgi:hypothetical protein
LLLFARVDNAVRLFPGTKQYARYSDDLHGFFRRSDISPLLAGRGIIVKDFGTHSVRKGSATYCASGSTSSPSDIAIKIRGGWTMDGVEGRYFKFSAAGDQFVGRVVCGLPINGAEFGILPPYFTDGDASIVCEAIATFFPGVPDTFRQVCKFVLASLVYHHTYLQETLPSQHILRQTAFFADARLVTMLKQHVRCGFASRETPISATGVILHNEQIIRLEKLSEAVERLSDRLQESETNVLKGVDELLEKKAVHANAVTPDQLKSALRNELDATGIFSAISDLRELAMQKHSASQPESSDPTISQPELNPDAEQSPAPVHMWKNGTFHIVPEGFELPMNLPTLIAWQQYCCGNATQNLPPLRFLTAKDVKSRQRLHEYKRLMELLKAEATRMKIWQPRPTTVLATAIYEVCTILFDTFVTL